MQRDALIAGSEARLKESAGASLEARDAAITEDAESMPGKLPAQVDALDAAIAEYSAHREKLRGEINSELAKIEAKIELGITAADLLPLLQLLAKNI